MNISAIKGFNVLKQWFLNWEPGPIKGPEAPPGGPEGFEKFAKKVEIIEYNVYK